MLIHKGLFKHEDLKGNYSCIMLFSHMLEVYSETKNNKIDYSFNKSEELCMSEATYHRNKKTLMKNNFIKQLNNNKFEINLEKIKELDLIFEERQLKKEKEEQEMKEKIKTIQHSKYGSLRIVKVNDKDYVIAGDMLKILNYSHRYSPIIQRRCKVEKYFINNNEHNIIDENNILTMIQYSNSVSVSEKQEITNWLQKENVIKENKVVLSDKSETEFVSLLSEALKPFDIEGVKQFPVLNYKIDYYIPSLNIAIEYDENNHNYYSYDSQEGRQKEIEKELNCKFIRVSDEKSHGYNVGYVIKTLINLFDL